MILMLVSLPYELVISSPIDTMLMKRTLSMRLMIVMMKPQVLNQMLQVMPAPTKVIVFAPSVNHQIMNLVIIPTKMVPVMRMLKVVASLMAKLKTVRTWKSMPLRITNLRMM